MDAMNVRGTRYRTYYYHATNILYTSKCSKNISNLVHKLLKIRTFGGINTKFSIQSILSFLFIIVISVFVIREIKLKDISPILLKTGIAIRKR